MSIFRGDNQIKARGAVALTAIFFFISFGTIVFHELEDWTWIQSFYFTIVTLTTVGYGDLTPTSDDTRLFTAIFILFGVTIVVSAIGFVGNGYISRRTTKKEERKSGKAD